MNNLERHQQGKYSFSFVQYDVFDFPPESLVGRGIERSFLGDLLAVGTILVPVLTTLYEDSHYLVDGIKRVLHCQYICKMTDADVLPYGVGYDHIAAFQPIWAKMYYDISPNDQAAWSIISNMQRDANPLHTWFDMEQLQRAGKWEEASELYRFNKQVIKSVMVLGNLVEPDFWFEKYQNGMISEGNLFGLAKMGIPHQRAAKDWVINNPKKKFTVNNLKELRSARNAAALLSMPNLPNLIGQVATVEELYVILQGETLIEGPFRGKKDPGNYDLYQLVKVG